MNNITSATRFCKLVEAKLGWVPPNPHAPAWLAYKQEASKVTNKIATDPELYTWRNLELAVELLRREKKPRSPIGVFAHVARAVEMANEVEPDLDTQIREATAYEVRRGDPAGWVTRFARAQGAYRAQALAEWRESVK